MLGLERKENTKLWTSVRNVCRLGTLCGMLAMMPLVIGGCPPPMPPDCTADGAPDCSDDVFCNGAETCNAETLACEDGAEPCTDTQICLEETDNCVGTCEVDEDCVDDDGDACTSAACNAETGTCIAVNNTDVCDDGEPCTGDDVCLDGDCAGRAITDCCETDADCNAGFECELATNLCVETDPCEVVVCDPGFGCVDGTCEAGLCLDNTCDDGDACNGVETCDEATGDCVPGEDVVCDDGVFCNGAETCVSGFCVDGAAPCAPGCCEEDLHFCLLGCLSFNFTTGIDDLTGTGGDDVFRGVSALVNGTLSAGDSANGGAGNDQLQVFLTTADLGPDISIDNIERVFAQNTSSTARSLSTLGWTGLEELWTDNSLGAVTFTGMTALMQVGLANTSQDVTATFNNTALVGTNSVTVELDGSQDGASIVIGSTGLDGVETITVNSGGTAANRIDGVDDGGENQFTTLTLTGGQDVRIDGPIGTSVKTVDASAMTGAADVSVAALTSFTFTGSDQDDTIRATNIGPTDTIEGGLGDSDTLIVSGTFGTTTIDAVENLTLQPTAAAPSFDLTNTTGITAVRVEPTGAITDLSASGLPPSTTITVDSGSPVALGMAASAFTLETPAGSADSLALVFTGNANVALGAGNVTMTGFESASFTFNNNGTLNFAAGVGITDGGNTLKKVTLASNGAANIGNLAALLSSSTALNELDATGVTGTLTTAAANFPGTSMTINSGGGDDVIITGAGASTVNGGAGNDSITGGAGADVIDGGPGVDTLIGGNGIDTLTGGTGVDTFAFNTIVAAANANNMLDFAAGADGDIIRFNNAQITEVAAAGNVTFATGGAAAAALTAAVDNVIIVDTAANVLLTTPGAGAHNVLAIATDTGNIYYCAAGSCAANVVIGNIPISQVASLVSANFISQ